MRRAGVGSAVVVEGGARDRGRARDGHRTAEPVGRGRVRGVELGEQDARLDVEEVGGAGVRPEVIVVRRADDGGRARDGDREAELVELGRVGGDEAVQLEARGGVEQVGRAAAAAGVVVGGGTGEDGRAGDRNAPAELLPATRVVGRELEQQLAVGGVEHVHGSG